MTDSKPFSGKLAVLLSIASALCGTNAADAPFKSLYPEASPACACEDLLKVALPNTTIDSATIDPSDGSCRVVATVTVIVFDTPQQMK